MAVASAPASWRPRLSITAAGLFIALLVAVPLVGLFLDAAGASGADIFTPERLGTYLLDSLGLGIGTAIGTALIGTSAAWLVTACAFPGRRVFEWALVLPLAAPAYILAYAYSDFLQHAGPVQSLLRDVTGWGPRDYWFPNIRSLPGAVLVFSVALYPYVYLIARAAFLEQSPNLLEAARALGRGAWGAFFSVALPLARPAIVAGTALTMMEALADFGAVAHFGVPTFTTAIYEAYSYLGNRALAAALALILLAIVVVLLIVERAQRGRAATRQSAPGRERTPHTLHGARAAAAFAACFLPILLGALLPAGILLSLAVTHGHNILSARYLTLMAHTLLLGVCGALAVIAAAVVLAYAARATRSKALRGAISAAVVGYGIPGSVIAVAILIPLARLDNLLNHWMNAAFGVRPGLIFTGTIVALVYAYAVRFLMIGFRTATTSLARITPAMDEAARTLGRSESGVVRDVHLPLLRGSLMTAGLIVFVEVVKELPATLILRPFNLDTLATQAYRLASDERLPEASSAALAIFAVGLVSVLVLVRTIRRR